MIGNKFKYIFNEIDGTIMTMTDTEAMIEDCLARYHKLNDWERGFLDSLDDINDLNKITPKQYEVLERIWERIT